MQTVLDTNLGRIEVKCPWCIHKYPFFADIVVPEEQIAEMFSVVKAAYERILYLQNYDAARIAELTKLQHFPVYHIRG